MALDNLFILAAAGTVGMAKWMRLVWNHGMFTAMLVTGLHLTLSCDNGPNPCPRTLFLLRSILILSMPKSLEWHISGFAIEIL
jgi:hypothetical protein